MQKKIIPIIVIICVAVFLVLYQNESITDSDFLKNLRSDTNVSNPPLYEQNIEKFLHVTNLDEVQQKRQELIRYVWKKDLMSSELPMSIISNYNDSEFSDLKNLERIEKIEISMDKGVNSIVYHFIPKSSNQKLIIYHQGHEGSFVLGKKTIDYFLENNYSVLALSMPLIGQNNKPIVDTDFGKLQLLSHKYFELLESPSFTPMIYFLEPINISLNYLEKNYEYNEYNSMGISGGGWTVTVYSAIDPRISKTFAVAGSVPFFQRTTDDNIGDYEQINSDFYRIADYLDLYTMSAVGENRKFVQIFNKYDPCCFYGDQFETYGQVVKSTIKKIDSGYFQIYVDNSTKQHEISDYALRVIELEFE